MASYLLDLQQLTIEALYRIPWPATLALLLNTIIGLLGLTWFFFFIIAPTPRPPAASEKKFKTLNSDGEVTAPAPLPCWLDKMEQRRKKESKYEQCALESIPIEPAELFMSVIVPAFNEENRIVGMLEEAVNYLEHEYGLPSEKAGNPPEQNGTPIRRRPNPQPDINGHIPETINPSKPATDSQRGWEILIVDDGSTDSTSETALTFARTHQLNPRPRRNSGPWTPHHSNDQATTIPPGSIRLIKLKTNRGKGGAVTHGMRHARGAYIAFADADGASKFDDLGRLVSACQKLQARDHDDNNKINNTSNPPEKEPPSSTPTPFSPAIAIGSRAHLITSTAVVQRTLLRNLLMHTFHLLLRLLTPPATASIRDTQCGFKLFSRASLPHIIPHMHCEGWIFDVEMLMLAEFAGVPVAEVAVGWREVEGSKLNVLWDSVGMAIGLAVLRVCWAVGVYRKD